MTIEKKSLYSFLWFSAVHYRYTNMQEILLPSVRVTYCYTTNQLTATSGSKIRTIPCHSIDIEHEAQTLASRIAGRSVSAVVVNTDNFLFR